MQNLLHCLHNALPMAFERLDGTCIQQGEPGEVGAVEAVSGLVLGCCQCDCEGGISEEPCSRSLSQQ